jgi:hypothetical protein
MKKILSSWLLILIACTAFGANELGGLVDKTTGKAVSDARTVFPTYPAMSNMVSGIQTNPAISDNNMNSHGISNFSFLIIPNFL